MTSASRKAAAALLAAAVSAGSWWLNRRASAPSSTRLLPDLTLDLRADGAHVSDASLLPRATVLAVVDGDTLHVSWEGREERLRYYGVNTPERGDACYEEATRRNAALAGSEVLLGFDDRPRDRYGRLLAYVFTPEGVSVDAALVREGFGRAWTRDGRFRDAVAALEREAKAGRRGCLWAKGARPARPKKPRRGRVKGV